MKGIVIVVTGHPYYGRFAYNLAVSIKACEDFPIALLFTRSAITHLSEQQLNVFDKFVELPADAPKNTSCKMLAGKYSPWDDTILIDADTIWLPYKKPSQMFEEVEKYGQSIFGIIEGSEVAPHKNYPLWADADEIKSKYSLTVMLYQWRTEVLYFKKSHADVLNSAYGICQNPNLKSMKEFGGAAPDELGMNISAAMHGVIPPVIGWKASYWHLMHGHYIPPNEELYNSYYLLSMGSNFNDTGIKKIYNTLMGHYCMKMKTNYIFEIQSKRNFLAERAKF